MPAVRKVLAVNAVLLVVLIALAEGAFRLGGWRPPVDFSDLRYENDPVMGPWLLPSQVGFTQSACLQVEDIHVNAFGMRDRERDLEPSPGRTRIALVGDSFAQALQVPDAQTVSAQLEGVLGPRVEALNFGVSSTGTSVQLLRYRGLVRTFRPQIVLLLFFPGNDVTDNHPVLKRKGDPGMAPLSPYLLLDARGELAREPQRGRFHRTSPARGWLSRLALGQWALHVIDSSRIKAARAAGPVAGQAAAADDAGLVDEAWRITEAAIAAFHDESGRDGARFALAVLPYDIQAIGRTGDAGAETRTAVSRLRALGERRGFPVLDLAALFEDVVRRRGPTDMAFTCDGHWNAAAQAAAAVGLAAFLREQGWLP